MVEGETATLGQMLRSIKRPTPQARSRRRCAVQCVLPIHDWRCRCAKINRKTRRSLPVSCRDSAGGPTAVTRVSSLERCMCVKSERRGVALSLHTSVERVTKGHMRAGAAPEAREVRAALGPARPPTTSLRSDTTQCRSCSDTVMRHRKWSFGSGEALERGGRLRCHHDLPFVHLRTASQSVPAHPHCFRMLNARTSAPNALSQLSIYSSRIRGTSAHTLSHHCHYACYYC